MTDTENILKSFPTVKPDAIDLEMIATVEAETDKSTIDFDDFIKKMHLETKDC